ncbi:hypothetical protein M5D96_014113 [Drosophila gunungcola]|uniref:Uncharacterized protein n=1 Tax=Drosophila gunungcola TaxID=103775 RepID=A0A9P9YAU0_9MUSC|nr:hypothetical protein M5D96_014113 [Drosophila gunungcola]
MWCKNEKKKKHKKTLDNCALEFIRNAMIGEFTFTLDSQRSYINKTQMSYSRGKLASNIRK